MSIYPEFEPTYLYIKQHTITGKLYFGKTINQDINKYKGSGTHWVRHIKKHGRKYVVNLWYELFTNKEEIQEFALSFSKDMNIVESDQWLNIIPENGIDGNPPGIKLTQEHIDKIRKSNLDNHRHLTDEHKYIISDSNLGRIHSLEIRKNMGKANLGKTIPQTVKNKISNKLKGRPAHNKGLPGYNTGNTHTEETKQRLRDKHKLRKPPLIIKICLNCNSEFTAKYHTRKYCSKSCASSHRWLK